MLQESVPHSFVGVDSQYLDSSMRSFFQLMIRALGSAAEAEGFLDHARQLGQDFIALGVSMDNMLKMLRIKHYLFWKSLIDFAEPEERETIDVAYSHVFRLFERYTDQAVEAYFDHDSRLRIQSESRLDQLFLMLLRSQGKDLTLIARIEKMLGLTASKSWLTAVGVESEAKALHMEARRLNSMGYSAVCIELDTLPLLIAHLRQTTTNVPNDWLRTTVCGYTVAETTAQIPEAASVARLVALSLPPTAKGRWSIRDNWANIVVTLLADAAHHLLAETLLVSGLEQAIMEPRNLAILDTFLRTGSINSTAEFLYFHRNTILNRLRDFKNKTGLDPQVPSEAALLLLALNILRQRHGALDPVDS